MKLLQLCLVTSAVVLGIAVSPVREACGQSAFTPYCPASTITTARATAASTFNLDKIRAYTQSPSLSSANSFNLVTMVAHRGSWEFCPENTIEAHEAAADLGVEGDEMDLRLSAPGYNSSEGINYPNGEMYLTHDFDLRGEAPDLDSSNPQNIIYTATPDSLSGRPMVDRQGRPAYANTCVPVPVPVTSACTANTPIVMHSLNDMLRQVLAKARAAAQINPGTIVAGGGNWGRDLVQRGSVLVLDIKGGDTLLNYDATTPTIQCASNPAFKYCNVGVPGAVTETMAEVSAFEAANNVDLSKMIVYKLVYKRMTAAQWTALVNTYYSGQLNLPGLVLIVYNQNDNNLPVEIYNTSPSATSSAIVGSGYQSYSGYFIANWNVQWYNVSTWQWNLADLQGSSPATTVHGTESFQQFNAFPEGARSIAGGCCSTQPVQNWNQSTIEFIYQPTSSSLPFISSTFPRVITTSETVDQYQNANRYLANRGLRNTQQLQ